MNKRSGFTLVEIMIVVVIIAILAAIALPAFVRARQGTQTNICLNNLRMISGAKDQWAIENNKALGAAVVLPQINPYLKRGVPTCPLGQMYNLGSVGTDPRCVVFNAGTHASTL